MPNKQREALFVIDKTVPPLQKPLPPSAWEIVRPRDGRKSLFDETGGLNREMPGLRLLGELVGTSAPMQEIFAAVREVASTSASVLISGKSGTGKELVARQIHKLSRRANGPFVVINAAALPEGLIESELFGHEKGTFTGAMERHAGCFEQAHGGTLFLDEIGEMPPSMQPKLLRVLEDLRVRRLGGKNEFHVDARVVAATSADVRSRLRDDLYYRLSVFHIVLPPLRERKEDIPLIAKVMIQALNSKHGTRVTNLDSEVLDFFDKHDWPGNVRELRNVIERATIVAAVGTIQLRHIGFPEIGMHFGHNKSDRSGGIKDPTMFRPGQRLTQIKAAYIRLTLEHANYNRRRAAEMLGISLRALCYQLAKIEKGGQSS
ncbi:MAG TPA: sigma-54 dependent transcriptional regulator [Candidatus Angelobacter sp.]|nr:sigma-54 dependent transcriptional regulator [Candidatus Angelobacter sp.]